MPGGCGDRDADGQPQHPARAGHPGSLTRRSCGLSSGPGSRQRPSRTRPEGWEEPPVLLAAVPVLPSFPAGVFPAWIEAEISALAESTQTPRDLAAMVVLGVLATACGRRAVVKVTPDWSEPTNLYAVPAMASGTRKSPVYSPLVSPLLDAEKILADKAREAITEARTTRAIADKAAVEGGEGGRRSGCRGRRDRRRPGQERPGEAAGRGSQAGSRRRRRRQGQARRGDRGAGRAAAIADDTTPEKMAQLLAEQGGRLAILSDEGGPLVSLAGRYSTSKEPDAEVWLKGHNGLHGRDPRRPDRPPAGLGQEPGADRLPRGPAGRAAQAAPDPAAAGPRPAGPVPVRDAARQRRLPEDPHHAGPA